MPRPKLRVKSISRNGILKINFNQEMIVPPFVTDKNSARNLEEAVTLSEIDVTRDILDLQFELESDVDLNRIKYTLEIILRNDT